MIKSLSSEEAITDRRNWITRNLLTWYATTLLINAWRTYYGRSIKTEKELRKFIKVFRKHTVVGK